MSVLKVGDGVLRVVADQSGLPVPQAVTAIAEAVRARHGPGIAAVLFYGSCLREPDDHGKIIDLFLLADSYAKVHRSRLMRALNALLPPNVYYIETRLADGIARAKYALVALSQFERLVSRETLDPYFWARFAQPTVVVWARDHRVRERVEAALAEAAKTLVGETLPLIAPRFRAEELWTRAFVETYRTELRPEGPDRAHRLYLTFAERYRRVSDAILHEVPAELIESAAALRDRAAKRWQRRRLAGKLLSVLRLVKAALTFEDGAAYLVGKIQRHSGVRIELTSWQRRHPVLASSMLFWRLYRAGAFR